MRRTINRYRQGLLNVSEMNEIFKKHSISADSTGMGFDYKNQAWQGL